MYFATLIQSAVIKHIPNSLTSLNLVCGCLSIIAALHGDLTTASIYIGAAAVLDFFDGFVARALKAYSEIGKQLDSLADMVSFGAAPGMIFMMHSQQVLPSAGFTFGNYIWLLIPVFSAIRLAKFNIDTRQSDSFIGVPTPANAIFIASIPFVLQHDSVGLSTLFENTYFVIVFPVLSAYLLVAELPLLALKFKQFSWSGNEFRYLLIGASVLSVIIFGYSGISIAIILYILISIVSQIINTRNDKV
jgi:CDP-diacylglycerol--serine O-phosphatidyltransferase